MTSSIHHHRMVRRPHTNTIYSTHFILHFLSSRLLHFFRISSQYDRLERLLYSAVYYLTGNVRCLRDRVRQNINGNNSPVPCICAVRCECVSSEKRERGRERAGEKEREGARARARETKSGRMRQKQYTVAHLSDRNRNVVSRLT